MFFLWCFSNNFGVVHFFVRGVLGLVFGWLRGRGVDRKAVEEVAERIAGMGVPRRVALRLARRVVAGEYTVEEAVEAYEKARGKRVERLSSELVSGGAGKSWSSILGSAAARAERVERVLGGSLWGSSSSLFGPGDLLGGSAGSRSRRRRGGRRRRR